MDLSVFKFLSNNSVIYWAGMIFTALALAVSTRYTIKTLVNLWSKKTSTKESHADAKSKDVDTDANKEATVSDDNEKDKSEGDDSGNPLSGRDPLEYCSHIQGEVKRVKQRVTTKKIQENLTQDQLEEERKVQSEQLEYIFKLMAEQREKFGITSIDDVQQQMKLYA